MVNRLVHPLLRYLRQLHKDGGEGDLDDRQLLRRFLAERDEAAFAVLLKRHGPLVWGVCARRLGETAEAEDAFQATFLVLLRKPPALHGPHALGPWLYGVAWRTTGKIRQQRTRRASRERPLTAHTTEPAAAEQGEPGWKDVRPVIDEEVNRLPARYREAVLLCYLQGRSTEEAARILGCAQGTIFSRLSRGRDLLRKRLSKRGLSVSAGALAVMLADHIAAQSAPPAPLSETVLRRSLVFAAGSSGQGPTAPAVALVNGVLRDMIHHKVKVVLIALLVVGLIGSGAGLVAHRLRAQQPEPLPGPELPRPKAKGEPERPEPRPIPRAERPKVERPKDRASVLKARFDLALKGYQAALDGLGQTRRFGNTISLTHTTDDVHTWSVRWLQAERDLKPKHEDQIAALKAHLERMKKLKPKVENLAQDLIPHIKVDEAEWYVLEAELWLMEAKTAKK